jgi:hypothetical protein
VCLPLTGTNFCIRAAPLADCGWFPTYTITEDYALGIELKKRDYKAVYINEYLAVGEAPEEIRNIFRQRSRWCKGQMQVCGNASHAASCAGVCAGAGLCRAVHRGAAGHPLLASTACMPAHFAVQQCSCMDCAYVLCCPHVQQAPTHTSRPEH